MKKTTCTFFILSAGVVFGWFLSNYFYTDNLTYTKSSQEKEPLYWVAPMDPSYKRDKPGKSPMGMDLVPVYGSNDSANSVTISPEVVNNLGVKTSVAQVKTIPRNINTVGYINPNEKQMHHVHVHVNGWIKQLEVNEVGQYVKKGQLLFTFYSHELAEAQQELLVLIDNENINYTQAIKAKLTSLGVSESQINDILRNKKVEPEFKVYAEQSGYISELSARKGMYIHPDMNIMTIQDISTVWLSVEIFSRYLPWVKVNQTAKIKFNSYPNETWTGKVDYIYPEIDNKIRTAKARIIINNAEGKLNPGMFANVLINGNPIKNALAIPAQAVIRTGYDNRVVLSLGNGKFESRSVSIGEEVDGKIVITEGLKPGDQFVTSAQFLIDSESNTQASFERIAPMKDMEANNSDKPQTHNH